MADSVQYAIDIAARMSGTETFAQLDQLTASLATSGRGAEHFGLAAQRVATDLQAASSASTTAAEALAQGNAQWRDLEQALVRASRAAERAAKSNDGVVPFELAAAVAAAESNLDAYKETLRALETDAARAAATEAALAKQLANVRTAAAHVDKRLAMNSEGLAKLQAGLSASGTSAGRLGARLIEPAKGFADLSQVVGKSNAVLLLAASAAAAAALAVVALGAAFVAGVAGVAAWAIGIADARRSADLTRQAAAAADPALGALQPTIARLARSTMLAEADLGGLAKSLRDAKVSAAEMPAALEAAALAESALGKGGAADYIAQLKAGKLEVKAFAAESRRNFGGVVAKQMTSLDGIAKTFKGNIGDLFGGLNIEPVLAALQTLADLFNVNTATGRAMKAVFEGVFQPLINQAQTAAWVVEALFLGLGIGALKAYIALKPAIQKIAAALNNDTSGIEIEDVLAAVAKAAEFAAPVLLALGAAFGAVLAAVGLLGAAFAAMNVAAVVAVLGTLGASVWGLVSSVGAIVARVREAGAGLTGAFSGAVNGALAFLRGVPAQLQALGGDLIAGLVRGITAGGGAVAAAVTGVATSAIGAAKAALGIASPSKVFASIGEDTGAGAAVGLARSTPRVQGAMAAMVEPPAPASVSALAGLTAAPAPAPVSALAGLEAPEPGGSQAPAQGRAAPAAGVTVNVAAGAVVVQATADAGDTVERVRDAIDRLVRGAAAQLAGEAAPA